MVGRQTKSILAADRPINGRESSRALTGRAHRRVQGHGLLSLANPVIGSHSMSNSFMGDAIYRS
jgi:hypothetical protein